MFWALGPENTSLSIYWQDREKLHPAAQFSERDSLQLPPLTVSEL